MFLFLVHICKYTFFQQLYVFIVIVIFYFLKLERTSLLNFTKNYILKNLINLYYLF